MKLPNEIIEFVQKADQKALATYCSGELNVVPVSVVRVMGDDIWLHDFFMNKTVKNVCEEPRVALALWSGLEGVQIKGHMKYESEGDRFEEANTWAKEQFPDRTLKGVLVLTPEAVFDASAKTDGAGDKLH